MLRRREYTLGDPKSEVSVRKIVRYTKSFRVEDEIKDGQEFNIVNVNESVVSRRGALPRMGVCFRGQASTMSSSEVSTMVALGLEGD